MSVNSLLRGLSSWMFYHYKKYQFSFLRSLTFLDSRPLILLNRPCKINYDFNLESSIIDHCLFKFFFQSLDGYVLSNYQDGRKWNQTCVSIHEGRQGVN